MLSQEFYEDLARQIDDQLEHAAGERMGFTVLVFRTGAPGIAHYVCNCDRSDMIKALRETADRLEANQDKPG